MVTQTATCHLTTAHKNGVIRTEMAEILTHGLAQRLGANDAYARFFTVKSSLNPLTEPEKTVFVANVTFESGFRNNRHIHRAKVGGGRLLICVDGEGWYQEERQACPQPEATRRGDDSCQRQAWARREGEQLVQPSGDGMPR